MKMKQKASDTLTQTLKDDFKNRPPRAIREKVLEKELVVAKKAYEKAYEKIKPLAAYVEKIEFSLREAREGYDIGEKVSIEETCRRGCCTEFEATGKIVGKKGGLYTVCYLWNGLSETRDVYSGDLNRIR
jgi:hypothetical protein